MRQHPRTSPATVEKTVHDTAATLVGLQPERIGSAGLWVLPNPSGLNANYQAPDLARLFRELRDSL